MVGVRRLLLGLLQLLLVEDRHRLGTVSSKGLKDRVCERLLDQTGDKLL